ncbi:hypothetical protein E1Z16_10870 [Listeria monocytogenes]|uniref:hypothetical protein n=1 Tax=Listeria TaxID=1637 RepID=UPI000BE042BC|nr:MULTISPECIES: hypothetical protein [Listeria]EAC2738450.1 hypothetical protein [Listeria monocytogenes]EAD0206957.1 hypothetical protein [Listeria monocytogenes]EAD0226324.1 hypothetical protein [Listeria monocytogenes]EAD6207601.1 hypothetical protein [Listeria monocytogenes]EAD6220812.1 hypothetical protein [Listeria monocytogenes]
MAKLNIGLNEVEALKNDGDLAVSETENYVLLDELQTYQDHGKLKERFIVRQGETGEVLELTVVKTFRGRSDLVGRVNSATTKPLNSALKKRLEPKQEPSVTASAFRDKLTQVKKELAK